MSSNDTGSSAAADPRRTFFTTWVLDFHNRTVLFRAGNWLFTTYAFLAAAAFAAGFGGTLWYNAMVGLDVVYMAKLYLFLAVPGVLIGLRAFSVMLEWRELFRRPLATLVKPGYMLHGGIAGGTIAVIAISSITGVSVPRLLDAPALALPLGEAIARLGCYAYGCCWGRPTQSRFGVRYTSKDSKVVRCAPHLENVRIHPAQLYALVVYLGMFAALYAMLPYVPFDGFIAGSYLIGHSLIRYNLERFRQDDRGRLLGTLTHTNLYSALMILGGATVMYLGWASGSAPHIDLSVRLVHVISDPAILPWIAMYGLVFGFAFGVHYKKVGSWISSPSVGMEPCVHDASPDAEAAVEAEMDRDETDRDQ